MQKFDAQKQVEIRLQINGQTVSGYATPRMLLSDFIREEIGLTGTHVGCEHGVCGACTVCIDGRAVRSCLILAIQTQGSLIETVEGLSEQEGTLNPLQLAFKRNHALQCGYCTPGILMSLKDFLAQHPKPTKEEIKAVLSGHLCRCTGYSGILAAVEDYVIEQLGKEGTTE